MPRIPVSPEDQWGAALNADLDSIEAKANAAIAAMGNPESDLAAYYTDQKQQ
jgi:hypothetical protein